MGAGAVAGEEVAGATPLFAFQADLMVAVLAVEVDAQAGDPHAGPLLGIALCLFDLADDARVHRRPPKTRAPGPRQVLESSDIDDSHVDLIIDVEALAAKGSACGWGCFVPAHLSGPP